MDPYVGNCNSLTATNYRGNVLGICCNPRTSPYCMPKCCIMGPTLYLPHIPFATMQLTLPFLRYGYLEIWPWKPNSKVIGEVKGQGHKVGPTIYTDLFGILLFQNLTLKVQGQDHSSRSYSWHNILSTHTPFVPCRSTIHSWDEPFKKFDL